MKGEFSMRRIFFTLLAGCLVYGVGLFAATGQFVAVEVEAFESWGILNWGTWNLVEEELQSVQILQMDIDDSRSVASMLADCNEYPPGWLSARGSGACEAASLFHFVREGQYNLNPSLGSPYRIRLRNLTAGYLGIVLAIDGLNTYDNASIVGDASDQKWILRPFQSVVISGWQVTDDVALQFEFAPPSQVHSSLEEHRGTIYLAAYLDLYEVSVMAGGDEDIGMDGEGRGTAAAEQIDQPVVRIPFHSVTTRPVETLTFNYSRDRVILGIQCEETQGAGIRIAAVVQGTAAEQAGLRSGDIITYANAIPINTCSDMQELLDSKSPGDRIILKVHRPERVFLITVELD